MKRLLNLVASALLTFLATPALAIDPALVEMVEKGFDACLANRTRTFKAQDALEQAGWKSQGSTGNLRLYFADGFRATAATTPAFSKENICGFGIKDMNEAEAVKLAERILRERVGGEIERAGKKLLKSGEVAGFGAKRGNDVTLAVVQREVNYSPYYRGSLIFFGFTTAE